MDGWHDGWAVLLLLRQESSRRKAADFHTQNGHNSGVLYVITAILVFTCVPRVPRLAFTGNILQHMNISPLLFVSLPQGVFFPIRLFVDFFSQFIN